MSRPGINGAGRAIAAAVALAALLAGCSDIYYDRRETVSLGAGDAMAANGVEQMVDPWPAHSNNRNLAFSGERMQRAVECYRKNRITPPVDLDPSTDTGVQPTTAASTTCQGPMTSTSNSAPQANGAGSGDSPNPTSR
jgi:hypothetical protein